MWTGLTRYCETKEFDFTPINLCRQQAVCDVQEIFISVMLLSLGRFKRRLRDKVALQQNSKMNVNGVERMSLHHTQLRRLLMLDTKKLHLILQRQTDEKNHSERTQSQVYKDQMREIQYFLAWKGVFSSAWTSSTLVGPVFNSGRLVSRLKSGSNRQIVGCRNIESSDKAVEHKDACGGRCLQKEG